MNRPVSLLGVLVIMELCTTVVGFSQENLEQDRRKRTSQVVKPSHDTAMSLYRDAIAIRQRGELDLAEGKVQQALRMADADASHHGRVARSLMELKEFRMAADELKRAIAISENGSLSNLLNRGRLVSALENAGDYVQAADAMKGYVEVFDLKPDVKRRVESWGWSKADSAGRMHFLMAKHCEKEGEREEQMMQLEAAVEVSENPNIDALIAMHRLKADEEWRNKTQQNVSDSTAALRAKASRLEAQLRAPGQSDRLLSVLLAKCFNDLAWLAANTNGDIDEAIEDAKRACELSPDSAPFLDTLARCYFLKGDLEKALEYQKRAVDLEPNVAELVDHLREIKDSVAKGGA